MRKRTQLISILLVLLFGVLMLKHLVPYSQEVAYEDCHEIWHIHTSLLHDHKESHFAEASTSSQPQKSETCHAGKSVFSYSLFPIAIAESFEPSFHIVFDVISTIENGFGGPSLEPLRKPPKIFV